jgi:DMSO/TMAO reductase YedYZ molybdopterin-dependent catalytic subunit
VNAPAKSLLPAAPDRPALGGRFGGLVLGGAAGAIAAAVAIAVAELIAGLVPGAPSLVIAIGALAIDLQPPGAKDLVVGLFGTNDKLALNIFIIVVALLVAGALGVRARRDFRTAAGGFVVFGLVGLFAASREPLVSPILALVTTALAVGAGLLALRTLVDAASDEPPPLTAGAAAKPAATMPDWHRRRFLLSSATFAGGALVVGGAGRYLLERSHPGGSPASAPTIPQPLGSAAPVTADETFTVDGLTPLVMPNELFYRIDTALLVPRVDVSTWTLRVSGMVDRPLSFTYEQLVALPLFEQYVTIACVSNKVGGDLVGNALWAGVRLRDVLEMAGVRAGATQIVGRSVDDFSAGFPTEWAMDPAREPMIAVKMNGQPLPAEHGYPARLIIPGLYGYVSATKWLSEIQLTTLEAVDGYWIPLGWSKLGPILTQSRIDVPSHGSELPAGPVTIAGIAWAPDRGVSGVDVEIDGAFHATEITHAISKATWVQWRYTWAATTGDHTIEVRATDGTGEVQTAERTEPAPSGARGHHTVAVRVV